MPNNEHDEQMFLVREGLIRCFQMIDLVKSRDEVIKFMLPLLVKRHPLLTEKEIRSILEEVVPITRLV
jgi:hypothetical protein